MDTITIEMYHSTHADADLRILEALESVLTEQGVEISTEDQASLADLRENYSRVASTAFPDVDAEMAYVDTAEILISRFESLLSEKSIMAWPDGETGLYTIQEDENIARITDVKKVRLGDWALHKDGQLDPRPVQEIDVKREKIRLRIGSVVTPWLPASSYTYSRTA